MLMFEHGKAQCWQNSRATSAGHSKVLQQRRSLLQAFSGQHTEKCQRQAWACSTVLRPAQVAALEKENRELGERSAAVGLEASEKGREAVELGAKLAAAGKAAEKLRHALKKLERERDARPLPEALVGRPSLCIFSPATCSLPLVRCGFYIMVGGAKALDGWLL